ncbi:hypothetical protein MPEAHAMD_1162 [Methylobacterium frigidaeris]|uniref:Uncharacterized protein n=3 Tax=Methylobacterium frigidaeris TaxID=2038277 RepID=A0AA37H877_9HYPH|nr:hypothetical protein MPEAHAMD_1162 [Methylobacterium frigidaeris]
MNCAAIAAAIGSTFAGAEARDFSAPEAYLAYLKLAQPADLSTYIPEYRLHFAPPSSRTSNEFDSESEEKRLLTTLKRNVSSFDLNEPFELQLSVQFGEYNFEKKAFNFHPLSASNVFASGRISLVFLNTRQFDGLPMDESQARAFVQRNPSRTVAATVRFVPKEAIEDTNRIKASIVGIEVFSDSRRQNLIYVMK